MRILAIADEEEKYLWDYYQPGKLDGIDLILSAGDLDPQYLSFLATFTSAPVLYIHGNHDGKYLKNPPEGCQCVDGHLVKVKGLRILGLGGSMRYNNGPFQYTENEMQRRVKKQRFSLWRQGGVDILLTHAPARGVGDGEDLPHRGFDCFNKLIATYQPKYFIHGHMHRSYTAGKDHAPVVLEQTRVINACPRTTFCYEDPLPENAHILHL